MSALSGPCAKYAVEYDWTAERAFQRADPLEDLIAPEGDDPRVLDLNIRAVPSELREFLLRPQSGARQVAKRFFAQVTNLRREAFAKAASLLAPPISGRIFEVTPTDQGHFGLAYYDHVLRGLRHSLPDDIRALIQDGEVSDSNEYAGLAGIAVVLL